MALDDYDDTNESFYDDVSMRLSCHRDRPLVVLDGGGLWIALGETGGSIGIRESDPVWYWTDVGSDDLARVWFDRRDTVSILDVIAEAERRQQPLKIGASSDGGTVVAWFDVTGFAIDRACLPR